MNGTQQLQQGAQGAMPQGGFPQGGPPGGMGGAGGFGMLPGGPMASIVILALFAITLIVLAIAFYKLFQKAGLNGGLGLLMLVPVVNLGVALYLAFAEWPVLAELARVKLAIASGVAQSPAVPAPGASAAVPIPDAGAQAVPFGG
jgi:hypothetical protein